LRRFAAVAFLLLAALGARAADPPAAEREYFASRTVQLYYDVVAGGDAQGTRVELWITRDGGRTWTAAAGARAEVTSEGQGCLSFDLAEDGEYGLKTCAQDEQGNADDRPAPGEAPFLIAVIDTAPPDLRLEAPEPGSWGQAGGRLSVKWTCADANLGLDPVDLDASEDGGGTWKSVAKGLPASGERFVDLPAAETPDFRVRLRGRDRAGNLGTTALARGVVVRATRPSGEPEKFSSATLPPSRSNSREFDIEYAVDDVGTAGLQSVVLWWTADGGATWQAYGKDEDRTSPFRFRAADDGTFGFVLQAIDNAHRASVPDPTPGTPPTRVTIVDTQVPKVGLVAPIGGVLTGGARFDVRWVASDANLGPTPVTLLWSLDGGVSWAPISSSPVANTGTFVWEVPSLVSSRVKVKVVIVDLAGNSAEGASGEMALASATAGPPRIQIVGVRSAGPSPIGDLRGHTPTQDPKDGPGAYERGKVLRAEGKLADARDAFLVALAADPTLLAAANDLGVVLEELGNEAGAAEAYARAKGISPKDPEVRYNLARALLAAGKPAGSVAEAKEALSILKSQDNLVLTFAKLLWKASLAALEADDLASAREAWGLIAAVERPDNRWRDSATEMLEKYGR